MIDVGLSMLLFGLGVANLLLKVSFYAATLEKRFFQEFLVGFYM